MVKKWNLRTIPVTKTAPLKDIAFLANQSFATTPTFSQNLPKTTLLPSESHAFPKVPTFKKNVQVQKPIYIFVVFGFGYISKPEDSSKTRESLIQCNAYEARRSQSIPISIEIDQEATAKKIKINVYFATWWALNVAFNIYNNKNSSGSIKVAPLNDMDFSANQSFATTPTFSQNLPKTTLLPSESHAFPKVPTFKKNVQAHKPIYIFVVFGFGYISKPENSSKIRESSIQCNAYEACRSQSSRLSSKLIRRRRPIRSRSAFISPLGGF